MSEANNNPTSVSDKFKSVISTQVNLVDVLYTTMRHWPWVLASVIAFVGMAWVYVMRTPPVYTRTSSILIKGDATSKSSSSELDVFASMGLVPPTSTNINDELNKLLSPDVMSEVVRTLNLNVSYEDDGNWHRNLLYGTTQPISVSFPSLLDSESASLTVNVQSNGEFTLSDLRLNGEELDSPGRAFHYGDTIVSSIGPVIVNMTPYMKPNENLKVFVTRVPMRSAVSQFSHEFTATRTDQKANVITLTVNDLSPQRAEDMLNTIINVYNDKWLQDRNQITVATSKFINERLDVIENELGSVDTDISNFQSENLIPDVQQAASMYMDENREAEAEITALTTSQQVARHLRAYVDTPENKYAAMPANIGIDNSSIVSLIDKYNELAIQREQYVNNTAVTHPVVLNLESSMAAMRQAIIGSLDAYIETIDSNIRNLRGIKNATTARLAANPVQAKYLLSVERQQKVKEELYLFLLQKREENELSQAFTAYNTEVITRPSGSPAPTSPQKAKILLGAFVFGLILPFGISYLKVSSNNRVRGRKDVEMLSMPFLGEIPECKSHKGEKSDRIVVKQGKRNVVNEAFRVLRTNLGFMANSDQGCSVIMVTSFNPGSGKTFLTMNLAMSLAIKGKKVLVIDGDLRRATSSSYIGSPSKGMSNYLINIIDDIHSVIVEDQSAPNLSILPVGAIPPNPTELLETERFAAVIKELRADYDYIFIDCPPVEMMADAQIINTVSDRTIFVIRAGLFVRAMLPELERIYDERKFKNMCLVLNATPAGESRAYGKYGYSYGYGYGNYSHYTTED